MEEQELKFKEHFDRSSVLVQDYLLGGDYASAIASIGRLFKFHIDKIGQLSDFVTYLVVGVIPAHEAEKKFIEYLPEYSSQVKDILQEVEKTILSKVRGITTVPVESKMTPNNVTEPSAIINRPTSASRVVSTDGSNVLHISKITPTPQGQDVAPNSSEVTLKTLSSPTDTAQQKTEPQDADVSKNLVKVSTDPYREPVD